MSRYSQFRPVYLSVTSCVSSTQYSRSNDSINLRQCGAKRRNLQEDVTAAISNTRRPATPRLNCNATAASASIFPAEAQTSPSACPKTVSSTRKAHRNNSNAAISKTGLSAIFAAIAGRVFCQWLLPYLACDLSEQVRWMIQACLLPTWQFLPLTSKVFNIFRTACPLLKGCLAKS